MSTPGENMFLNVNAPLQLGGRQSQPNLPAGITNNKFNGCVRNLRHNNEVSLLFLTPFFLILNPIPKGKATSGFNLPVTYLHVKSFLTDPEV